jgi:hypothetical protein
MLLSCHIDTVSSLLTVRIVPSTGIVFGCEDGVAAAGDGSLKSQIEMLRISLVDLTVPETQARKQGSEVSCASYG